MHVLIVLTSHDQLGDTGLKTGFWLEEFASPYYELIDNGAEVTLASPKGGQPPIDPKSDETDFQTAATDRFKQDEDAQKQLANTVKLAEINSADYDAVFYPGGHGPLWDLTNDADSIRLISEFFDASKPVAAVCHAPGVFKDVKRQDGLSLVNGKTVTGFTNSEEDAVELTDVVPYLVEDMLCDANADFQCGEDWTSFVVRDGNLITGQNPASSEGVASELLSLLK